MCHDTLMKITIATISSGPRLMMPLACYAKNENLGLVEIAANPGSREETPNSKSDYLVN
jgi:hypothetical protein